MSAAAVKTRFAPSPTGSLHVGGARTALFNWLVARQTGGAFLLRIEDTDRQRHQEAAICEIVRDLRWLGLDWDEGVEVGGPAGPYRQSQRLDIYRRHASRLLSEGKAYYALETTEDLEAMRAEAAKRKEALRYRRPDPAPTEADAQRARADGRPVVIRLLMPDRPITVEDRILGPVTLSPEEFDDFVILKADGWPTYHLANVVDDALMGVNFVMRGQEFLAQTARHIALQESLGIPTPQYAHLPLILDMKGRKLSKRDGDVEVYAFRQAGYLPEVMVNFLSLLGWSPPGGEREKFTRDELIEAFSVERIGRANARFDREKLLAFNTTAAAEAPEDRLLAGLKDYCQVNDTPLRRADDQRLRVVLRVCKGFRTFADVEAKSRFLFLDDQEMEYEPEAVKKVLHKGDAAGIKMLAAMLGVLKSAEDWSPAGLEGLLNAAAEQHGVGLGKVAQPIRVAISGRTISPAIFESLHLLGKDVALRRIRATIERFGGPEAGS
jgi:glutamyl-tRNA synthetase